MLVCNQKAYAAYLYFMHHVLTRWVLQSTAAGKRLAYEGYCHLPEVSSKEWYWTQKGTQCGPYSLAELFEMTQGTTVMLAIETLAQIFHALEPL